MRIETSFHHMNDNGFYDGWTTHVVTFRPLLTGLTITVSGRDRDEIKDYIRDVFDVWATTEGENEWLKMVYRG